MLVCSAIALLLTIGAVPTPTVDALVVRPAAWSPAVQTWKQYRLQQGIAVAEVDAELGRSGIQAVAIEFSRRPGKNLKYLLLAGDVATETTPTDKVPLSLVPTWYQNSTAMVRFGGEPEIGTDNPYGDLDGDQIPDLAVGRIPADTPEELKQILERTILYETNRDHGSWRRNVHVVAGVGGFGALADSVIEMTTRRFLTERVPGWAEVTMTYGSPTSPYCPDPWRFCESTIDRMNEGGTFWVYVGHGHIKTLDYLKVGEQFIEIMTNAHVPKVNVAHRPPIAVFLSCYTGAFDAREDCLAEQLLKHPTGPVAALAASRVTGPYGMSMMASGMLSACYDMRENCVGDVVLHAKREMLRDERPPNGDAPTTVAPRDAQLKLIESIAAALSPKEHDLRSERVEHVWQMNLLGDPMLRLSHPGLVELKVPERLQPGEELLVTGTVPVAGSLQLELSLRRDSLPPGLKPASAYSADESIRAAQHECYLSANRRVLCRLDKILPIGHFECRLQVPNELPPGRYCVRAYLASDTAWAAGFTTISIRAKQKTEP